MMIDEQVINEVLAKKLKMNALDSETSKAYKAADDFLLKQVGSIPDWFEAFLESNKRKLVETICRATSPGAGIASLAGYNEGYFNEIIQNANDLHSGNNVKVFTSISANKYTVRCQYADHGFSLSNIYGFLNREMSDKTAEDGQTGKFGVGIKSFFNFVDTLEIRSNVIFSFGINRSEENVDVHGKVYVNDSWDGKTTELAFSFDGGIDEKFNTGFNINKLKALIDYLDGRNMYQPLRFFLEGENEELLFDARSLIFMGVAQKFGKNPDSSVIQRIDFSGRRHRIEISCRELEKNDRLEIDDSVWNIAKLQLRVLVDGYEEFDESYLQMAQSDVAFAYPLEKRLEAENRFYSTYYIKTDDQERILPMGVLINSKFANIHRNDLGDSEDSINKAYNVIYKRFGKLYELMCSEQIADCGDIAVSISDIFYSLLERYLDCDKDVYPESPLNTEGLESKYLPKMLNGTNKPYVVDHEKIEKYQVAAYSEGNIEEELTSLYFSYIERGKVYDLMELINSNQTIPGVSRLFAKLSERYDVDEDVIINYDRIQDITNYFKNVGSFITYIVSGEKKKTLEDACIDKWLLSLKQETGKYFNAENFLKLIGRYELNNAIEFDGSIKPQNLSFKDYIFNDQLNEAEGILASLQTEQFKDKYASIKSELLKKRLIDVNNEKNKYQIRYMIPTGKSRSNWDGTADYYSMSTSEVDTKPFTEPLNLIERLANDSIFSGAVCYTTGKLLLFENAARHMRCRENTFMHYMTYQQQIVDLSSLKTVRLRSFFDFVKAIDFRRKIQKAEIQEFIGLKCYEDHLTTHEIINGILPQLVVDPKDGSSRLLDEFGPDDVIIEKIVENTNNESPEENRKFIETITGYDIHFYRFDSASRRKTLAYCNNDGFFLRTDASKNFTRIATSKLSGKDLYIFYDNFADDIQSAIPIVLEQIGISKKALEILKGYIHNGNNTKSLSYVSRMRNIAKVKRKLVLDWAELNQDDIELIYDNEVLYRLLTARGSYDVFCPICADVPLEAFDFDENDKRKHSRKLIILENENLETKNEVPYVVTVACSYCFEKLKNSLSASEFDGKNLILTTQLAHGQFEKAKSKQQIELSPVNIEIMKKFKMI